MSTVDFDRIMSELDNLAKQIDDTEFVSIGQTIAIAHDFNEIKDERLSSVIADVKFNERHCICMNFEDIIESTAESDRAEKLLEFCINLLNTTEYQQPKYEVKNGRIVKK